MRYRRGSSGFLILIIVALVGVIAYQNPGMVEDLGVDLDSLGVSGSSPCDGISTFFQHINEENYGDAEEMYLGTEFSTSELSQYDSIDLVDCMCDDVIDGTFPSTQYTDMEEMVSGQVDSNITRRGLAFFTMNITGIPESEQFDQFEDRDWATMSLYAPMLETANTTGWQLVTLAPYEMANLTAVNISKVANEYGVCEGWAAENAREPYYTQAQADTIN